MKQSLSVLSQTEDTIRRYTLAMETEVNPSKNYEHSIVSCLRALVSRYTELSIHSNHCSIVHDIVGSNHSNPKALFFKIEKSQVWDYS